jgi:hypothetical protein
VPPAEGSEPPRFLRLLRHLDVLALALALPVFLLADLSLLGYLVGGGAWLVQKAIAMALQRRADASRDPRTVVGLLMGGAILRGWLCAGAVLAVGLTDERAGLAATLLVLLLFTVYISIKFVERGLSALDAAASRGAGGAAAPSAGPGAST